MRNHIEEMHGEGSLAEAAQIALANHKIAAVMIRSFANVQALPLFETGTQQFMEQVYEALPALHDLDDFLAGYAREQGDLRIGLTPQVQVGIQNSLNTGTHIDTDEEYIPGLTLSLRVDRNYELKRFFAARRLGKSTLSSQGSLRTNPIHWAEMWPSHFGTHLPLGPFGRAEQRPGDLCLLPGHPFPAMHRMRGQRRKGQYTSALVMDYALAVRSTVQNTNTI